MVGYFKKPARHLFSMILALSLCVVQPSANAQEHISSDRHYFIDIGFGVATFQTSGRLIDNLPIPISKPHVALRDHRIITFELGRRLSPHWSISVRAGLPPTADLYGLGDFSDQGEFGKAKYGTIMMGGQYHLLSTGRFEPYIGAGLSYTLILKARDRSILNLDVNNTTGPYLRLGWRYGVTEKTDLLMDITKLWQSFDARGIAPGPYGPLPVSVRIKPDPVVVIFGISHRF